MKEEVPRDVPPWAPPWFVERPELDRHLAGVVHRRLTTLVAGAGYGKSTALSAWAAQTGAAWCTLTAEDAALGVLVPAVVDALGLELPAAATSVLGGLAVDTDAAASVEPLAGMLGQALDGGPGGDRTLVLDDVQEIGATGAASRLLGALCRQAPPQLHLVLASREEVPFAIERLRGRGQVLEIPASLLALSPTDVENLLAASLTDGSDVSRLAERLHELTQGWPAGVRLAAEALRRLPPDRREVTLDELRRPGSPLFSYLAEEVFGAEPDEVRITLQRVSPLHRFTADLCRALGVRGADEALSGLIRRGLFVRVQPGPGAWLTLHDLARTFAAEAWPMPPEERREILLRAAAWCEAGGHAEDALRSYTDAGAHEDVVRLLRDNGVTMLAHGGADTIVRTASVLPHAHRGPEIEQLLGEAHTIKGQTDLALACLRRAARAAPSASSGLAWRTVQALALRDELDEAIAVAEQHLAPEPAGVDDAMLLGYAATSYRRRGDHPRAVALAERALDAAYACADDRAIALAENAMGICFDSGGGRRWRPYLDRALAAAERAGDVLQIIRVRNNLGSSLMEEGAYPDALIELDAAIELAELSGFRMLLALALMNRGLARWCLGRLEEAAEDYDAATEVYRSADSQEVCYAIIGKGDVHRERGDLALAQAAYEDGLTIAERSGDLQGLVPALYQLAKVLVNDDPARASELAGRAVAYGWPDRAWALDAAGWVALAHGDLERARGFAVRAEEAARELHDPIGLAEALELRTFADENPAANGHLLRQALAIWEEVGNPIRTAGVDLALARLSTEADASDRAASAERTLRSLGVRVGADGPAGLLRTVARVRTTAVEIRTLGGFRVILAGRPVPLTAWQSKKARELLMLLVARRGRSLPREQIMETLWPDDDPGRVANRLAVALSTLRSVLNPERSDGSDRYVGADRDSVWLESERVAVDLESFLTQAEAGLRAARDGLPADDLLMGAETAYAGDFLEEHPYEDWAIGIREEARASYIAVTRALAIAAEQRGDVEATIRYRLRLLERDPYDEAAHLGVVEVLQGAGRHGEARRRYRLYAAQMQDIEVEPAPFPAGDATRSERAASP